MDSADQERPNPVTGGGWFISGYEARRSALEPSDARENRGCNQILMLTNRSGRLSLETIGQRIRRRTSCSNLMVVSFQFDCYNIRRCASNDFNQRFQRQSLPEILSRFFCHFVIFNVLWGFQSFLLGTLLRVAFIILFLHNWVDAIKFSFLSLFSMSPSHLPLFPLPLFFCSPFIFNFKLLGAKAISNELHMRELLEMLTFSRDLYLASSARCAPPLSNGVLKNHERRYKSHDYR